MYVSVHKVTGSVKASSASSPLFVLKCPFIHTLVAVTKRTVFNNPTRERTSPRSSISSLGIKKDVKTGHSFF